MYPMQMEPVFKDYLWGGGRLAAEYGKKTSMYPVAESWEVSCHPDGLSLVRNGAFAKEPLAGVIHQHSEYLGTAVSGTEFPILIKLIDAKESSSLQVHPPDEYARKTEGQAGKNEMWYVLDAKPDTTLRLGCAVPVSRQEFKRRTEDGTILEIVAAVPVRAGDCFLIPAGMVHAIGKGALIAEIQQNSNITYRVHDFGRLDAAGNPRKLHVEQAAEVADTRLQAVNCSENASQSYEGYRSTPLAAWRWFNTRLLEIRTHAKLMSGNESFACLLVIAGKLLLKWNGTEFPVHKGESVFIPAGIGAYTLYGAGKALLTRA